MTARGDRTRDYAQNRAREAIKRAERRADGVCVNCCDDLDRAGTLCQACCTRMATRRLRLRQAGICPCGHEPCGAYTLGPICRLKARVQRRETGPRRRETTVSPTFWRQVTSAWE